VSRAPAGPVLLLPSLFWRAELRLSQVDVGAVVDVRVVVDVGLWLWLTLGCGCGCSWGCGCGSS
jgi:hypothetical protein